MEFFVEIDETDESPNHKVHMIAGAIAGVVEHVGVFPIDTLRTIAQSNQDLREWRMAFRETVRAVIANRGVWGLFRGFPMMAAGVAPVHGMSFAVYEAVRHMAGGAAEGGALRSGLAGVVATLAHDAFLTPLDTVKQRLQSSARPYRNSAECVAALWRSGGLRPFYAGYTTTLAMNIPYGAIYYGAYESIKVRMRALLGRDPAEHHAPSHLLAGAIGGALAALITNPLDVSRTRLQVGADIGWTSRGMVRTLGLIWRNEGLLGFTRGVRPRMAVHSLSAAMSWTAYEYVKFILTPILK